MTARELAELLLALPAEQQQLDVKYYVPAAVMGDWYDDITRPPSIETYDGKQFVALTGY